VPIVWSDGGSAQCVLPCGFVYAAQPIFDVEVPIVGLTATELPNECFLLMEKKKQTQQHALSYENQKLVKLIKPSSPPSSSQGNAPIIIECGIGAPCDMSCGGRLVFRGLTKSLDIVPTKFIATTTTTLSGSGGGGGKQRSLKQAPQIYPTTLRKENEVEGWSVRSLHVINVGEFVCEFIGRVSPATRKDIQHAIAVNDRFSFFFF
jgi:hypothetical protein